MVTLREVAKYVREAAIVEEMAYPPPRFRGAEVLANFLRECVMERETDIDTLCNKWGIN